MNEKTKQLYNSGLKNKKFLDAIYEADKDVKPNVFSDSADKHVFAAVDYGWLVSEHGIAWKLYL